MKTGDYIVLALYAIIAILSAMDTVASEGFSVLCVYLWNGPRVVHNLGSDPVHSTVRSSLRQGTHPAFLNWSLYMQIDKSVNPCE